MALKNQTEEHRKYLELLAREFPTQEATVTEIINLQAIINLPKGTEHFMSDLHGEYEAFYHILNNSSGVIREKVDMLFSESMNDRDRKNLCTLIYYPKEKLDMLVEVGLMSETWAKTTLRRLLRLARLLSSKYTRSKVRKAMPEDFRYVLDELLHAQPDEDQNRYVYHAKILDTIWETGSFRSFIYALTYLIKRLAVDHLHIVGDIYDRGPYAHKIMDRLMQHHSVDVQWGNHDVLWMGAAAGSIPCIINVIRNNVRYNNWEILENGYGISMRDFVTFAAENYQKDESKNALVKAINVMLFKAEGQAMLRHPEFKLEDRLNLMFHGGLPMNEDGTFRPVTLRGKTLKGRAYMDWVDHLARICFRRRKLEDQDFFWFLWIHPDSPVTGRTIKTFERSYIDDESTWPEPQDPYYKLHRKKEICEKVLHEFGLDSPQSHIINGHTPVKVAKGDTPVRAGGKEICIDGGFCKAYQKSTGIAGYTLIFNSHGIRIKAHYPFQDIEHVLTTNADIDSVTTQVEMEPKRVMIGDTDNGQNLKQQISDLTDLLEAYRDGMIMEKK